MIDKKNRREKWKSSTQHKTDNLNLSSIVSKSKGARAKPFGQGANLETPIPKKGQEGFHRVLLNHHQVKPLPFQEHAIPLAVVFS